MVSSMELLRAWILSHDNVQDCRLDGDMLRIGFWTKDCVQDCWFTEFDWVRDIRGARNALGY